MAIAITPVVGALSPERLRALFGEDASRAADWVRVLALEGHRPAQLCYGRMLLEGTGLKRDPAAALVLFEQASRAGDPEALNMLGRCLENGWGAAPDPGRAADCYAQAAARGDAWAQYNLGHLCLNGQGVPRDAAAAFRWYAQAAGQGHERAMNLVGRCYEHGWGVGRDPAAAAYWYERSARGGYFRGQYNWASILLESDRVEEATPWLERAARGGSPGVRAAVLALVQKRGCHPALEALAARLRDGSRDDEPSAR